MTYAGKFYNELAISQVQVPVTKSFLFFKWKSTKTLFHLERPLVYFSRELNGFIVVPKNFLTDLASHPIKMLGFAPPYESNPPAVCHDELYSLCFFFKLNIDGSFSYTQLAKNEKARKEFDRVLKEALLVAGFTKFDAFCWYHAVRLGGKGAWLEKDDTPDLTFDIDYLQSLKLPDSLLKEVRRAEAKLSEF